MLKTIPGLTDAQTLFIYNIGSSEGTPIHHQSEEIISSPRTVRSLVRRGLLEFVKEENRFKLTGSGQLIYIRILNSNKPK